MVLFDPGLRWLWDRNSWVESSSQELDALLKKSASGSAACEVRFNSVSFFSSSHHFFHGLSGMQFEFQLFCKHEFGATTQEKPLEENDIDWLAGVFEDHRIYHWCSSQ